VVSWVTSQRRSGDDARFDPPPLRGDASLIPTVSRKQCNTHPFAGAPRSGRLSVVRDNLAYEMSRHATFRFCLDPTVEQCEVLARHAGAARFAFNQCLQA
jgi:Helix-turn-helix domain